MVALVVDENVFSPAPIDVALALHEQPRRFIEEMLHPTPGDPEVDGIPPLNLQATLLINLRPLLVLGFILQQPAIAPSHLDLGLVDAQRKMHPIFPHGKTRVVEGLGEAADERGSVVAHVYVLMVSDYNL